MMAWSMPVLFVLVRTGWAIFLLVALVAVAVAIRNVSKDRE